MVYYTGDTHGKTLRITNALAQGIITKEDTIVILGDAGFNYQGYYLGDARKKKLIKNAQVTVFCIHGNHEMRPENIPSYITKSWNGGIVYYEAEFPNLLFAKDGEIYNLDGKSSVAIGGAYSVDKQYRILNGMPYFEDEQPSDEVKRRVEDVLESCNWQIDQVLSHTCPFKYIPDEAKFKGSDDLIIDNSTEEWLDIIEDRLTYKRWLCGHWHISKSVDKIHFLMEDIII